MKNIKAFLLSGIIHLFVIFVFFTFLQTKRDKEVLLIDLKDVNPVKLASSKNFLSQNKRKKPRISPKAPFKEKKSQPFYADQPEELPKNFSSEKSKSEKPLSTFSLPPHDETGGFVEKSESNEIPASSEISLSEIPLNPPEESRKEELKETYLKEKLSIISKILKKHLRYPYLARKMGWEGEVLVSFILTPKGEVKELNLEKSSGYEILDRYTLETIKKISSSFPHPPIEVKIRLPVTYRLN